MTHYAEGEAPWSEDEQFKQRKLECKERRKLFGCDTQGYYQGDCDGCLEDAVRSLTEKHLRASAITGKDGGSNG